MGILREEHIVSVPPQNPQSDGRRQMKANNYDTYRSLREVFRGSEERGNKYLLSINDVSVRDP